MTYTITTTNNPAGTPYVVSDAEYLDLLRQGLIATATPGGVDSTPTDPAWLGPDGPVHFTDDIQVDGLTTVGNATGNGKLIIRQHGAAAVGTLPDGISGNGGGGGLYIVGSFDGSEDDAAGGHYDSSPHINLYHYQRAANGSYGESLRHYMMIADAKACIAWWFPTGGYNASTELPTGSTWKPQAWVIAHSKANDNVSYHNHLSFEVMSPSNGLTTRLEIPFVDQETWAAGDPFAGVATTNIRTHDADLTVSADSGVLRVGGANAYNKDILLSGSSLRAAAGERWKIRVDNTTEAGSNVGSDFLIRRHSDAGAFIDNAVYIRRSDGRVVIGGAAGSSDTGSAKLSLIWSGNSIHGLRVAPTATPGNAAGVAFQMTVTTDRIIESRVAGDANASVVVYTDGKVEWGTAASRDTNLYRSGADTLKTDDSLHVAARLGIGQAPDATIKAGITQAVDAAGIYIVNTTAGGNVNQPSIRCDSVTATSLASGSRVTGDASARYARLVDGKTAWGDGTSARDTNLYRSAAGVLKTDNSFHAGADLRHLGTNLGFYNAAAVAKQTISGSRGGNAALADLLTKLATLGLITDSTTA